MFLNSQNSTDYFYAYMHPKGKEIFQNQKF